MNKIFKVIWSKSKQCYIVVSEIAKNKTGKKKIVVAGIFAALAMVNGVQDSQAINGSGARTGWNSNGVGFHPTQGLVVGPNMNDNTTIANGNVATVAIGAHSNASGSSSVAIGGAVVNGAGAIGLGWSTATGDNSVALGGTGSTNANGNNAFAASGGNASGESAIAIGSSAIAGGRGGVAVGWSAESAVNAVGIGFNAKAKANNTVAIGVQANNDNSIGDNSSSVSIGVKTRAREVGSMAMGVSADASGKYSIALGSGDVVNDYTNGTNYPKATGEKAIAIGYNSNASDANAIAIGSNTLAKDAESIAVGTSNTTAYSGGVALGRNAKAENTAINNVAVGIDVTAGANTNGKADGEAVAVGRNAKANSFRTVAIGSDVSATGSTAVAMGRSANVSNNYGVAVGARVEAGNYGVALGYQAKSTASGALAIGAGNDDTKGMATATTASGGNSVAIGASAKASIANAVALGSNSITDKDATEQKSATINSITYNFAGATSDTGMQVSVGAAGKERQIKNVAAGEVSATSTDAVNGSQLFAVASQIKPINYFSVKSSAVGNKNNDGATGTDAVAIGPGTQSSGNNGVSLGNGSQANAESVVSIGYQSNLGAQSNSNSIGIGWAAGQQSNGSENVGIGTNAGRKLTGSNNISVGNGAGSGDIYSSGSVLLGKSATIINSTTATPINDVVAIGNGAQGGAASSIAIGKGANALGFSTIAIGENSNAKTTTGAAPSLAIGRYTIANGDYAVALGGGDNYGKFQGAKAAGVGTTAIGAATVTKDNTNFQTAVGFGAQTDAIDASAFGHEASAMAKNATALGSAASATAENATAIGTGASAKVKDGVAIGSSSKATVDKGVKGYDPNDGRTNKYGGLAGNVLTSTNAAVSVGDSSSVTRQITGVAAGTNNTDAVNVAQLKSVNLAFSGNSGNNDVNLANGTLAIKGDTTYITTTANTNGITIAGKKQDISVNTNGVASANKGMADAQNVAQSINDAISKNAYTWTVSANGDAGESVAKGNTVDFTGDSNITVDRTGKKITTKLNKDITVDSVKANNKVTVGTAAKQLVLDGTTGAMTAGTGTNTIKLDGTSATITAGLGSNAISLNGTNAQAAFGSGTNAVSINGTTGSVTGKAFTAGSTTINTTGLTSGTGSSAVSFGTNGISAGNQAIKNVSTGGSTDSNAANIGDVKRYVSGATLNLTDGANNKGSVQLGDQSLKVTAGTGLMATVSGQTVNIGLTTDAQNAISSGIGLLGNVGNTGIKQLKDGNATFDIKGDGSVVKTTASNSGVTIAVDTDKLAANTNLAYTANGASTAKNVALSKGLNFVNGSNTIAIVNDDGKVSFDLNAATKNQINTNTTGVVANKASIATNAADIVTNKNKIAANTTDIAINKGKIATNTTNIAANTTALARSISLGADSGAKSSQSLSTTDVAFNVKGATGDYISTKMNGNTVEVSTKRSTINSDTNSGAASVTGADGLVTAKNVADVINNAVTKSAYEWRLSANSEANPTTVGKGDIVDFTGGSNITVERDNKNISVKLNKNLTNLSSVSIGNNKGETIKLDGSNGGITADHADFKDNTGAGTSIDSSGIRINNGIADLTQIGMGSILLDNGRGSNTVVTTSSVSLTDGSNISEYNAKGIAFGDTTGTNTAQFGLEGISAANQQIKDVAAGTDDTDAVNVKQLKDIVGDQKLSISDGTKDSSVALKNQKLTVTGTGAAKATVSGQTITIDVAEGTLTPNTTNGTVTGTTGVAKATEVAAAINNTNTVLGNKITKNTQDIATNKANITANKNQIDTNTANIATNTTNIANTIALADDKGASTTAKSLKDGNVSFNIKGDNKYISTAASGNDVTLTVDEQAIKDAAKSASSFKVKANTHAEEEVKGGDTIAFNNGDNIEISQNGKTFTIGTAKNITVDSVTAGNTIINTSGLTNGTTAITGTGITTDKVTVGGISIDKTAGINAGGKVISNVASGTVNNNATDDSNAANIGDVKQAVANLSQNLNITDGTNNGTVDLKNQKLNVVGANGVTATVNNQTITVGLDANTVNATTKGIGLTGDTGSTGNKYLKDGDVSFAVTGDGNLVSTSATTAGVKVAVDAAKVKDLAVAAVTVSKDTQADNPITVTPTAGINSKDYAIGIDTTKLAAKTDLTYRANSAADANAKKVSLSKGLNFVDGGSTVATVDNDGKVSFDLNTATKNQINTNTTDIAANKGNITKNTAAIATNTAALARNISLGADAGTASSQSLSAADVAFNVKGATGDFVSTNMNGNTVEISTKRATINSNATTGEASVTGNDGLATAQNVADAINKAADAAKAGAAWNITTNSSTTDKTAVKGGDTVDLVNGDNIEITQDGTDKKKITVATKKDITVDSVTANNKVTVGSGANKITLDGTDGSVTGKAFTGTTFTGTSFTGTSFTAGNTVINTNGLTNGTTAITGTGVTTDNVTVGDISIDKTAGINAGNKVISNVASGGTTLTNAANIGDVQNAVANLSQNLNITDGTHDGTVDLKNQKLNVAGANGVTATVNNQTITVGLDANTVNATTKGIGLTADTGSTGNKYLKDGDVSFAVTGDGSLVSTSATAAGVKVAVNSASITAGADGTITAPTTDGVATAKNVADAINAAKKASKTEITANTGEAANATTGNVTLTSTTAADGHTIYDVKLNDKVTLGTGANAVTIDGTSGAITGKTATIGGVTVNGTANTIGGLSNTTWNGTAVSGRAATEDQLKAATGATTLKFTGDVATNTGSVNLKDDTFGIKGDGKYISTDVNGKNVNLTVSEAEVKKSAVAAVTVSTDTTDANNPLTVTPTTSADGTTKDYKVTIDGTKIANKTNLSYKANNGTAKQVSLADGLNFKNGTLTTASIDDAGVVKYDVNTASITAGTDGTITGPTTDGVATAKNVADAINAAKKASKTEITANTGEAANATTGNVTLTSTTAADGHTIYDVKLNDKVTLGSGANAVTIDGTTGAITGKTATIGGVTVNGTANTIGGLSNTTWNGTATTGRAATEDQLKAVADAASSQTWNITADKAGTTGNQTGTKKNATVGKDETVELVAGDNLTINQNERKFTYSLNKDLAGLTSVSIGTGTTETIKLDGATGKITAKNAVIGGVTVDGDNNHVTGLANTTWNGTATTGRAATEDQLKAVAETSKTTTDAVNLKFSGNTNTSPGVVNLKDDTLGIVGDGKYVSTDANGKNLTVKVSEAEVKKSAVAAVTVSTDTTDANNPISVTPTTSADGTTKDYKVTIDGTKIANKTNLSYKANGGTVKQVSLADGLNFKNGTLTTASIDDAGVVKYDVNTASITAGADGTITGPTTDGVATAQNVADAINAAKKASKTEITANTGEAANATTGNVTLTSTTAADGHTIYDVKLNDKVTLGSGANAVTIDGTAGKATIGSSVINGVNNTFTTGGAKAVTLDGATGTITGTTANIGGVTVNGTANTIGGLSNTTWNGTATTGRAATEDQLKAVADAAGSQTWEITADKDAATSGAQTGTKKNAKVGKDDKVQLIAGENLTVNQNERDFTYSLNKDLVKMNSATFEATGGKTTVIKGDSIVQTDGANVNTSNATSNTITDGTNTSTITAGKAQIGTVGIDGVASKISTGGTNAVVVNGADGTVKTGNVTVTGGTTNDITGLSNTTVTGADFATKGRAATEEQLKAATGATTLKFTGDVATNTGSVNLKDDTFGIKGDNKYISTDVNGKNVNLTVSEAEVKKSAVAAVTVSTDTTDTNNPLTVTPTTSADGTTKDYKVTIDGTKIANKTNLSYKANDGTAKQVSLADGLNFKNGTLTTASIDDNGVVKYDVNTASINAGTDGTITGPTTDGVATAQNVADAINAAKKAAKTEITANAGEAANATTGNVTLTSTTAADGHTIYDVKLNDKVTLGTGANAVTIDGTAGKATVGSSVIDGVNNTFTTGGASPVTLNGATGTITGKTANIGGVTVDGTNNHVMGLANKDWTPGVTQAVSGRAATEDQLQKVSDAVGAGWKVNTGKVTGSTGESNGAASTKVASGEEVQFQAGNNLIVDQNGKTVAYSLNKALKDLESATFNGTGTNKTVITGDSITQTAGTQTNTSTAGGNTVADGTKSTETTAAGQVIKDGAKTNTSTVDENTIVDGAKSNKTTVDSNVIDAGNGNVNTSNATSNTITDGTNTSTITAGKATIGTSIVDGVNNTFTTGGTNAVKLDGVAGTIKTGTVTVTGGTTNDITGLSNTTVTAADFATKGRAATEEQLKAVGEQTWQITADKDATTSGTQTGTKKDAKVGKDDKVQLIAGENMTVNQNERDFTFTLNKDLVKMNSATFLGTGTNKTVITGDSIAQTAGTQTNTSTAGGNTVADGTKSTKTTADGQVIKDGAKTNTSTVDENTLVDGAKSNKTTVDSNVIDDGTNTSTITAGKATIGSSIIDGVNNTFTTGGASPVTLNGATGTITGKTANIGGVTVDGTNNHVMGLANKDWTPGVTQAVSGRAATEDQLQKVSDAVGAGWKVNTGKVTGSTGESNGAASTKVASGEEVQFQAGNNLIVDQNGKTVAYSLNKALKDLESATFNGTGTNKTVITGDSITQTAGTQTNTSTAGGNTVADGTKSTETTAAGQVIKDGTKTNTSTVDENTIVDGTKSNKSTVDGNTITDGTNTTVTTSSSVTVKDNAGNSTVITKDNITTGVGGNKIILDGTAGKATIGSSIVDGVNNTFTTGGANAVKLDGAAGTIKTGTVTVTGGTTNDITGLSNTTVTSADFATKGRAATEEQLKAVGEQTWQITADKDATTS
ncbi:MAG: ESPR-type extended signal peptide-containing protein, partial [Veillonella sp.]|nr:ESPR-type extended signal peptide-containing protein [Veillonella sp.]